MDKSVRPGDEFYLYANGAWEKNTEMRPDRAVESPASDIYDQHEQKLKDLIDESAKSQDRNSQRIAALYHSYMDEAAIEAAGTKPVESQLKAIAAISDKHALARALGETLRADVDALNMTNFHTENLFGMWVAPGFDDSDHYHAYLMQGGIVLPDREYYLSDSESMREIRTRYEQHVETILKLAGMDDPDGRAKRVVALEHAIALTHWTLAEDNDVHKANNIWKPADFASKAPGLDWAEYFRAAGLDKQNSFYVWQPSAFTGESALVASTPLDDWKDWLTFHTVEEYASILPKAFADEEFEFWGKTLNGVSVQQPRWRRGVAVVDGHLPSELGRLYVQRHFPPEVKAQVQAMVSNLIAVYRQRLHSITWMAPATKSQAIAKLDSLYVGIGYPDRWEEENFEVKADDIAGNLRRSREAKYQRERGLIGTEVDRKRWCMSPQTINAVNLPLQNSLNFPAAILQVPSFDANAPAAANYGAIGAVIGHEISHTFDSEGSAFDSKGRLRNWWTKDDFAHFNGVTDRLARQYDAYKPFPDLALNGKQTLAENIADDAGLAAAYDAYKASLKGQTAPEQDGFNGDQQFYIAYAQSWADKLRPSTLRNEVMTDTHSPGHWRVFEVRNQNEWYKAFDIKPDEKLYLAPEERVQIW
ncbi:MAG: M13 family metallopeptidase [Acidobacteria bacterium]|nr:M13 family metallopeptidase [Acidobacteriota bacterium]